MLSHKLCSHASFFPPTLSQYLSFLSTLNSLFLPPPYICLCVFLPFTPYVWCQHSLSVPRSSSPSLFSSASLFLLSTALPSVFSSPLSCLPQSVIVKSVERNAVNMYEARKFLLGLESNGVSSSSSPSVVLNPAPNGPSPSLICPVGLDILASAGLGLSNLGKDTVWPVEELRLQYSVSFINVQEKEKLLPSSSVLHEDINVLVEELMFFCINVVTCTRQTQ